MIPIFRVTAKNIFCICPSSPYIYDKNLDFYSIYYFMIYFLKKEIGTEPLHIIYFFKKLYHECLFVFSSFFKHSFQTIASIPLLRCVIVS